MAFYYQNTGCRTFLSIESFDILSKIKKYTDLFLYDIKGINDEPHKKVTSVSNALILKNVKALSRSTDIIVRYPLIFNIDNTETDIAAFRIYLFDPGRPRGYTPLPKQEKEKN